jgi:hypothetical protein
MTKARRAGRLLRRLPEVRWAGAARAARECGDAWLAGEVAFDARVGASGVDGSWRALRSAALAAVYAEPSRREARRAVADLCAGRPGPRWLSAARRWARRWGPGARERLSWLAWAEADLRGLSVHDAEDCGCPLSPADWRRLAGDRAVLHAVLVLLREGGCSEGQVARVGSAVARLDAAAVAALRADLSVAVPASELSRRAWLRGLSAWWAFDPGPRGIDTGAEGAPREQV